ncbi:MAG: hypothetical protein N2559_05060 [Anaerolineae bacterium]|nr:hypothetical protein [Anaerolineae bacterium]
MPRLSRIQKLFLLTSLAGLAVLSCQVGELVARANPTATRTLGATARATFTRLPFTLVPSPTQPPPPPPPPPPTVRPSPTRTRTPIPKPNVPLAPPPPSATPDLFGGYYYRPVFKGCVADSNTRIEGTVYENGVKKNGVIVRLSHAEHAEPLIKDFVTGTDPRDHKHQAPEWEGRYRLGIAEGQRIDGNWWVFIVDATGNPLSKGYYIKTHDGPGCNVATVDFVH